jgi:ATP-dependent exoDNAse (exonuclease V) alpha subunit
VATGRSSDLLTVVGPLLGAQPGESLCLRGRWASHSQYGRQFQVEAYDTVLPATMQGICRYLGSGLIKGIGPKMAERIVDHFGQATLLEAATLHRLLQLRPGGDAAFDPDHPLDADLVVVDEASMLDVLLANKLIKAIPPGAQLLVAGDVDQLPSVGAGEVLRDLLAAERLPRVRLTKVFRQAQQSGVVTNAHRINAGQHPVTRGLADFFLFPEDDPDQVAELVVEIVASRLSRRFGLDPTREVQVLSSEKGWGRE